MGAGSIDARPYPRYTHGMISASDLRRNSDALAALTALKDRLPGDYLIVGPHASYAYHRWMFPVAKMIHLRIRADGREKWRAVLGEPWTVRDQTSTSGDMYSAVRLAVLETTLTEALWARRRMIDGLAYISLEDWCLELLSRAQSQISISEVTAMLIVQKDTLDWKYFLGRVAEDRTLPWLRAIIAMVNVEIGREFLRPAPMSQVSLDPHDSQPDVYFTTPSGRRRSLNRPLISRQIIGKVVLDLEYHWRMRERPIVA